MKTVLITGASRGIGRATARMFAQNGYDVGVHYHRSEGEAASLVRELAGYGVKAVPLQADVADYAQVERMTEAAQRELGGIGVLVNNAGIASQKLLTDVTPEEWRRMMGVHLDGAFYCCRQVIPEMVRRQDGVILNVSSMWGITGGSCEVPYSAAKAGLIGLTKALAKELGPSHIRVNGVAPGVIDTDMCAGLSEETRRQLREEAPLGCLGTPEDVARALYFLASPEASFITGQILGVNGGMVI